MAFFAGVDSFEWYNIAGFGRMAAVSFGGRRQANATQ